jgi:hypothetical protein
MRPVALSLMLTLTLAACLPPAGRLFNTTLIHKSPANPGGDYPLPVTLGDQTDLVVGIEPTDADESGGLAPLVKADPTDPNALIVSWLGGLCDNDAAVSFQPSGSGYTLHLDVHEKLGLGCPAAGLLRGLRIITSEPIPIDSIAASGSG